MQGAVNCPHWYKSGWAACRGQAESWAGGQTGVQNDLLCPGAVEEAGGKVLEGSQVPLRGLSRNGAHTQRRHWLTQITLGS